jgi:hypothetical protein
MKSTSEFLHICVLWKSKTQKYRFSSEMQNKTEINLLWQVENKITKSKVDLFKNQK